MTNQERVCNICGAEISFDGKKLTVKKDINKPLCKDCTEYMKNLKVNS